MMKSCATPAPLGRERAAVPLFTVLLLAALSAFGPLSIDMYLPAFPQIAEDLRASSGSIEITVPAFLVSAGICQALYGTISDRYGRRTPLLVGCFIFIIGTVACALAQSANMLIFSRMIQGLGSAAGIVIARAIVRDISTEREAAKLFSQLMLVMGVAPILAPWVGAQLLHFTSWRGIFGVLTLFGVLILLFCATKLPESHPRERRTTGGLPEALRNYGKLLRNRSFVGYILAAGLSSGTLFSYISGSPFVIMKLHEFSSHQFTLFFGLNACGLIGATQLNNLLLRFAQPKQILEYAYWGNAAAGVGLALCGFTGWGGFTPIAVCLFLALFHIGLIYPNIAAATLAPHGRLAGSASALLGANQFVTGAAAGAFIGFVANGTALPMTATMGLCGVLGLLSLKLLAQREERSSPE